jgi:hypothetical protein
MEKKNKMYWRFHLQGLQRGLSLLAAAGIPSLEVPKPSEPVRRFNSRIEKILKALDIKRRYQNEIVSYIQGAILSAARSKSQQAQMWLALLKEIGVEMTPAEMLEVLDAWEGMEGFLYRSSKRSFEDFFKEKDLRILVTINDDGDEDEDAEEVVFEEEKEKS